MKIVEVSVLRERVELVRPYAIAYKSTDAVELFVVRLQSDGPAVGLGSATPVEEITGESVDSCAACLTPSALDWLVGADVRQRAALTRRLGVELNDNPAARAALDMALHDLFARYLDLPLVDVLGRCHQRLPTSITIGIKSVDETLEEAREYVGRGFDHIKVKLGRSLDEDLERLERLRSELGQTIRIRVDANQGYDVDQLRALGRRLEPLELELIEQPLPADVVDDMQHLPVALRRRCAADESLHDELDALDRLQRPRGFGIFNVKLMKCGGVTPALNIAQTAASAGIDLMWGCMDESCIGIAAALHAAYACPATRFLDLDGSLDLARDPGNGGFTLKDGRMALTGAPGLGVTLTG